MSLALLGLAIWVVLGGGAWYFSSQLKALAIWTSLLAALGLMPLIGIIRSVIAIVTFVMKVGVEMLMLTLSEVTLLICKSLPPDQQEDWMGRSAKLTTWAKARSKMTLIDEESAAEAADQNKYASGNNPDQLPAYEWALKVMGLHEETELTLPKLKQRYRQMMTVIHPDKQFPNHVFAQQVNDAADAIKRHHGWR